MKSTAFLTLVALIMAMTVQDASAHGRLLVPPHRGYIGKLPQFNGLVPINFGDHGLSAGGIGQTRGGKHGICGDRYSGKRLHETGGEFAKFPQLREKVIGACYAPGSTMDLQVQLTANHMGYFEFGLCKLNSLNDKETEDCFKTLVQPNGEKDWKLPAGNKVFNMQYMLPDGVSCDGDSHCVLRWHYVGWNNPDVGIDGQEQFWNCADIYVSNTCGSSPSPSSSQSTPSTSTPSTSKPAMTNDSKPTAPSSSADTPVTTDTPPSTSGAPHPVDPQCGGCTNCYFAGNNACFIGWSKEQCDSTGWYKWCGIGGSDPSTPSSPKSAPSTNAPYPSYSTDTPVTMDTPPSTSGAPEPADPQCGGCTNCYFADRNKCFIGWSKQQCDSTGWYKWCGAGGSNPPPSPANAPNPSTTSSPKPSTTSSPKRTPSSIPSTTKQPTLSPSPGTPGVDKKVSWNWFASSTTDCDASLSKDTLNRGLYIGGENIPADCGKTASFTYDGRTVIATYAWRTTGGQGYNELSPQAFAQLLGSNANAANFNSASDFQAAIKDPGHVFSTCSGTC
ncbi:hypothetical protein B5M09_011989 [Aphanomyces astaci]|uniref:Uncharacterized protein n=1 Tax=Aphanomyces astaci TaxID=112090 RepID=A0A425CNX7_APHAT|nr:hypothetical protein B5M09_011989 [Aphanomyces astaci]